MMSADQKLVVLLAMLAEQSGEKVSEPRLEFICERLKPLGAAEVCEALTKMLDTARRFPTVDEIKQAMGLGGVTSLDAGRQVATLILEAIGKYGSLQPGNERGAEAIRLAIGAAAWETCQRLGGWNHVVDLAGDESEGMLRAQIRDLVESSVRTGQLKVDEVPAKLPPLSAAIEAVPAAKPLGLPEPERKVAHQTLAGLHAMRTQLQRDQLLEAIAKKQAVRRLSEREGVTPAEDIES